MPLYRRRVYAVAIYTMARRSELAALTPGDVDLAHRTIGIAKQADRHNPGETKRTKTKLARTIDIEPHVLPLVERLVKAPEGREGRLWLTCRRQRIAPSSFAKTSGRLASVVANFTTTTRAARKSGSTTFATPGSRTWPCEATRPSRFNGAAGTPRSP